MATLARDPAKRPLKSIKKAGITPWNRLFHSMRASRQTELEREFPLHVVCAWTGNSAAVAAKSYLLVTEDDYIKAIAAELSSPKRAARKAARLTVKATQKRHRKTQQPARTAQQKTRKTLGKLSFSQCFAGLQGWRITDLNR